ncbi:MAG: Sec-independent protein translocase subunit TatA/TatB [Gaiellaceae bacterium]
MAFLGPIGTPELIIIMVVLLLLFGAKRLPEMGRSVGRGMREFKDAVTGDEKQASDAGELSAPVEPHTHEPKTESTPADKAEREPVS